jgi:hypothetical protein
MGFTSQVQDRIAADQSFFRHVWVTHIANDDFHVPVPIHRPYGIADQHLDRKTVAQQTGDRMPSDKACCACYQDFLQDPLGSREGTRRLSNKSWHKLSVAPQSGAAKILGRQSPVRDDPSVAAWLDLL